MDVRLIELDRISGGNTQTRACLRPQAVAEYAEAIKAGERMEPGVVFDDGAALHLAAGFHRREAHRLAGRTQMECVVNQGTAWDAIQYGIRDNRKHQGERLTSGDKAHNIRLVLKEQPKWADETIAELCGATAKTVAKHRRAMESTLEIPELSCRIGRDGRVRDTSNLGRQPSGPRDVPQGASELDIEHHSCGGQWVSDGEGGRYCQRCYAPHPDNTEPYPGEASELAGGAMGVAGQSTQAAPSGPTQSTEALFLEAHRRLGYLKKTLDQLGNAYPGPQYEQAMLAADRVGKWLIAWQNVAA